MIFVHLVDFHRWEICIEITFEVFLSHFRNNDNAYIYRRYVFLMLSFSCYHENWRWCV